MKISLNCELIEDKEFYLSRKADAIVICKHKGYPIHNLLHQLSRKSTANQNNNTDVHTQGN